MGEFDLIKRYFSRKSLQNEVILSVGDDCAITSIPTGYQLAITTDTLVEGTHFLPSISPADLAYKSVAVNLSDLAAMGATPAWVSLALTLPEIKDEWLAEFSQSLFAILDRYGVSLIGGDTTKGPLSITLTAQGFLPENQGLFRHQAKVGDWIFVSGFLGDSAAGLDLLLQNRKIENESDRYFIQRHLHPTPRVELGLALRSFSCCALDISDGLLADLEHILERSQVGAEDYELCFTVSEEKREEMENVLRSQGIKVTCIGQILPATSCLNLLKNGKKMALPTHIGFDHFS